MSSYDAYKKRMYSHILDFTGRDDISMGLFDTWWNIAEKRLKNRFTKELPHQFDEEFRLTSILKDYSFWQGNQQDIDYYDYRLNELIEEIKNNE